MNEDILDLSRFHLTYPSGKPYAVFDPKKDGEYNDLYQFLHIAEVEELAFKEVFEKIEADGLDPNEPWHTSRIYGLLDIRDPKTGGKLKLKDDAGFYVLLQLMLKDGRYTSMWIAFLCPEDGLEALYADQEEYTETSRKYLELGHQQSSAGQN